MVCVIGYSTWPTPTKSEMFKNRKERNVIKSTYCELDSSICNVDAPLSSSPATCTLYQNVGEQDEGQVNCPTCWLNDRARYVSPSDDGHTIAGVITRARERMSAAYQKDFTSVR